MDIIQSKQLKLSYQVSLFFLLLIIGTILYPLPFAEMFFYMAAVSVFFIVNTLISKK